MTKKKKEWIALDVEKFLEIQQQHETHITRLLNVVMDVIKETVLVFNDPSKFTPNRFVSLHEQTLDSVESLKGDAENLLKALEKGKTIWQ